MTSSSLSRRRFRIEVAAAVLFGALALLTAVVPDWIEATFGVDPDAGSGSLEWALVAVAAVVALAISLTARREWRRLGAAT